MFTLHEIAKITKGRLIRGDGLLKIRGVSIDSRTVKKGDLFIAIMGRRFNGHRFIEEAVRRGAAGVVVSEDVKSEGRKEIAVIRVKDTVKALGLIARAHRDRVDIPVIAVTGSAGKTTTKDMVAAILKSRFYVLKNAGTENNHIGVPLTLLKLRPVHDIVVVELGTNRPGDIQWLTYVANPDVAIMTNIGEAHLELLKTPSRVFQEKFALVKGMTKKGMVIFNADDRYLRKIPSCGTGQRFITFAVEDKACLPCLPAGKAAGRADFRATKIKQDNKNTLHFHVNQFKGLSLKTPVIANVTNALAAISCGRLFQIPYQNIRKSIRGFRFTGGRQSLKKVKQCWLIDDTYNANPVSMRSALATLSSLRIEGRRILVCADMLELGARSRDYHLAMGRLAADSGLDLILTYGKLSAFVTQAAKIKRPELPAFHCRTRADVHKRLLGFYRPGDAVLVKGSRAMHMEKTVEFLSKAL